MPTHVDRDGYLRKVLGGQEQVLYLGRVHWLFFFVHNFLWFCLVAILIVFSTGVQFTQAAVNANSKMMLLFGLILVPLVPIFWSYQEWANHKFIVTNRRVLQMKGVLSKQVVDASLDQINDVKTEQSLFGRMFGYGDVEVVTASAILTDEMKHIANPLEFKRYLLDAKEALLHP